MDYGHPPTSTTMTSGLAWKESSPVVGSSQKMSDGVPKSWQAMERRFRSPPEMPLVFSSPTIVSATLLPAIKMHAVNIRIRERPCMLEVSCRSAATKGIIHPRIIIRIDVEAL